MNCLLHLFAIFSLIFSVLNAVKVEDCGTSNAVQFLYTDMGEPRKPSLRYCYNYQTAEQCEIDPSGDVFLKLDFKLSK